MDASQDAAKTAEPTSLRERKKMQVRDDIIRAAVELFRERGFDETNVDDIVERANYSRSTFFRYFGVKDDVVFPKTKQRFAEFSRILESGGDDDPIAVARRAMTEAAHQITAETTWLSTPALEDECVALWFSEPTLRRRYMEIVASYEDSLTDFFMKSWGERASEFESRVIAASIVGVARTVVACGLASAPRQLKSDLLNQGFDLVEAGLANHTLANVPARQPKLSN